MHHYSNLNFETQFDTLFYRQELGDTTHKTHNSQASKYGMDMEQCLQNWILLLWEGKVNYVGTPSATYQGLLRRLPQGLLRLNILGNEIRGK